MSQRVYSEGSCEKRLKLSIVLSRTDRSDVRRATSNPPLFYSLLPIRPLRGIDNVRRMGIQLSAQSQRILSVESTSDYRVPAIISVYHCSPRLSFALEESKAHQSDGAQ